jgi:hypothetical protein
MNRCPLPPPGWWCSREPGHEGPCAARPTMSESIRRYRLSYRLPPEWPETLVREYPYTGRVRLYDGFHRLPWPTEIHTVTLDAYDAEEARQRLEYRLLRECWFTTGSPSFAVYQLLDIEPEKA